MVSFFCLGSSVSKKLLAAVAIALRFFSLGLVLLFVCDWQGKTVPVKTRSIKKDLMTAAIKMNESSLKVSRNQIA
jgi:hypothetical protein